MALAIAGLCYYKLPLQREIVILFLLLSDWSTGSTLVKKSIGQMVADGCDEVGAALSMKQSGLCARTQNKGVAISKACPRQSPFL